MKQRHLWSAAILILSCASVVGVAAGAAAATVTVTAGSANGAPLNDVYIAIVADDRPWSDPAQETIAPRGKATWEVPPGTYRIVASAPRFTTEFAEPFTVAADAQKLFIGIKPLVPVRGFTVSKTGLPVAGASIRLLGGGGPLSVLGEQHRRVNSAATTPETGAFTIFATSDRNEAFLVEASGYAPAILDRARLASGPDNTVVLEEGASLLVRWSVPAAVERSEKVSLLPVDVKLPFGLTRERAVRTWTRPIAGSGQQWDSLPLGTYRIVVRAASAATGTGVPVEIGEVLLGPGDHPTVRVVLPPVPSQNEQPKARTIRVLVAGTAQNPDDLVVSHWRDGIRSDLASTKQQVSGGMLLTMSASCVAGTVVMIESSTGIGTAVLDGACEEPARVRLADRANLAARISAPRGTLPPRSGSLRFAKCAGNASSVEIPFAISDSRMRSGAPASCGEMSLHAAGFVPVRSSSQPLKVGESRDLGTIALTEGAAAVLRVRSGSDASPSEDVQITAIRQNDLAAMRGKFDVEPFALGKTVSDSSGWARLTGLPEGRVIFLMQGRGRKRPQISEPYELAAGEETVIDNLVLETPANVFVTLSVPESLKNALELHAVELEGTGHSHWPRRAPIRAELTPMGTVVEDVPPGTWTVRATGRLKNGFFLNVAESTIDVAAGVDRQITLTLTDTLYHGRVTRGGQGVNGTINLKPADKGSRLRHVVARMRHDGEFQVLLEGKGQYAASVEDSARRSGVKLDHYVTFDDPSDEVTIELPTGREIRGRVVDSAGSPVEEVSVHAVQQIAEPAGAVGAKNSADGGFVLDGVVPGRWELIAESTTERSERVMVTVGEGDVDGIRLVVDPLQTVKIRVVDMTGTPLSLVSVGAEFLAPGAVQPQYYGRSTGARGEVKFQLSHAQQASPTNVVIHSMSDGRLSCEVRRLDSDQTIQVGPHSGEVRLIARQWVTRPGTTSWLVSSGGCAVPFFATSEQESIGHEALVFKRLAVGRWTYVETHNAEELATVFTGRGSSLTPIKTFVVEPGKTTRVDLTEN